MGGMGSGVPCGSTAKGSTEATHRIDLVYMNREGLLKPGAGGTLSWRRGDRRTSSIGYRVAETHMRLRYTADGEAFDYPVSLSRTPYHFGGSRAWLHCPLVGCGRRVRVLYGARRYFTCRRCAALAYPSTREDAIDLHARRGDRIRRRIGWPEGMFNDEGGRPKGMHWRAYLRLLGEYQQHRMGFLRGVDARFRLGVFED